MRRIALVLIGLALLGAVLVAANFIHGWTGTGPATADRSLIVPEGATLRSQALALKAQGLIRSADAFLLRARIFGGSAPIKAGEYLIPKGASNAEILKILQEGIALHRLVTIPEGMPSAMVHDRLMAQPTLVGDIPVPEEGSILPDSYSYDRGESRAAVLARMQKAMDKALSEAWARRAPTTVAKTPREALILASIVEKETSKPSERTTVAAVYSNRLRVGMMLQADPTIIYPITKGRPLGRRIRKSEIAAVNDYNTYAMTGLPKGPIANPSKASIEAVLHPANSRALYFVADGTGGHVFADTLDQHNQNVRKWFEIRRARGEL